MNEVYLVWEDNGELWEDYQSYVIAVCSTLETAQNILKNEGYTKNPFVHPDNSWRPYGWWNRTTNTYSNPPKLEEFVEAYESDEKAALLAYESDLEWWDENKDAILYSTTQTAWIEKFEVL